MSPPAPVAVVTVSYNSGEALDSFLASVQQAGGDPAVIVADNASPEPGDLAAVTARYGAHLERMPRNLGYGGAVNAAVAGLDPAVQFVLVSNPDVVLHEGSLNLLVEAAERCPDAGTLGPRILDPGGATYPSARKLPSLRTGVGHALFGTVWPTNPWTRSYREDRNEGERDAGWLSGACLLIRREAFDQIGGFDTGYFMYFEDVDLGARLSRAGWRNRYIPAAVVTHTGAHSTSRSRTEMDRVHHRSAYRYLSRKYSAWYLAPLRLALRLGIAARERVSGRSRG